MKLSETDKPKSTTKPPPDKGPQTAALEVAEVDVDEHCVGSRWIAADIDHLARIIAIIAMGQAAHAAQIITDLRPGAPAIDHEALRKDATRRLSVNGKTDAQREVSRYQRDGLIFEAISWAAAKQTSSGKALLRDPHLSSTTQGLDGLMIELDKAGLVERATIFEDKCSEKPRETFRDKVMPAFKEHHGNGRASDLIATAAALIEKSGLGGTESIKAAARVLDKTYRTYRGSLAVTTGEDSLVRRKRLFKGYDQLEGIVPKQRIGATLITSDDLRAWFDELAIRAIAYIASLATGGA